MRSYSIQNTSYGRRQEGTIMLIVMLLVLMFTGLGLMAMRHTQGELRSAGAFLDASQGAFLAEMPIIMAATDMRLNNSVLCGDDVNYTAQLRKQIVGGNPNMLLRFSPDFQIDNSGDPPAADTDCPADAGQVPGLQDEPIAATPVLQNMRATASLSQGRLIQAAPPAGYSDSESNSTVGWFYFRMRSTLIYGTGDEAPGVDSSNTWGQTTARALVYIGPIENPVQ